MGRRTGRWLLPLVAVALATGTAAGAHAERRVLAASWNTATADLFRQIRIDPDGSAADRTSLPPLVGRDENDARYVVFMKPVFRTNHSAYSSWKVTKVEWTCAGAAVELAMPSVQWDSSTPAQALASMECTTCTSDMLADVFQRVLSGGSSCSTTGFRLSGESSPAPPSPSFFVTIESGDDFTIETRGPRRLGDGSFLYLWYSNRRGKTSIILNGGRLATNLFTPASTWMRYVLYPYELETGTNSIHVEITESSPPYSTASSPVTTFVP